MYLVDNVLWHGWLLIGHKLSPTAVGSTADGTLVGAPRCTVSTLNMGSSAGAGQVLAWDIDIYVLSTSPDHGYTSGALDEP